MKSSYAASIALTLAALSLAPAQQALVAAMGEQAKDLTMTVDTQGVANVDGWAQQP